MSVAELAREVDAIEGVKAPEEHTALVGHAEVFSRLTNQADRGRLPGGILLHGPRGVGKATLGFALVRYILEKTSDEEAHRIAEQVGGGVHPNIFVLRKKPKDSKAFFTSIRVEDVRDLVHKLQQTRGRAGSRICIVDAIDDCNASSANALLKMLEEPPADTHFILISHRAGRLLPTIRSRCQAHALRPLAETEIAQILNKTDATVEQVQQALALAAGRPRRAFEALLMVDNEVLQKLANWLQSPADSSVFETMKIAETLSTQKNAMQAGFAREMLLDWIATENREASMPDEGLSQGEQLRLASANLLWEKANSLFDDADTFNLDARQTLLSLLDAIKSHAQKTQASAMPANLE